MKAPIRRVTGYDIKDGQSSDFIHSPSVSYRMQDDPLVTDFINDSIVPDPERKQTLQVPVQRFSRARLKFKDQNLLAYSCLNLGPKLSEASVES